MATFVLVPGGWFGAWWYREAASELRRRGHQAHPVPLTGVGERAAQLTAAVNLDTHIRDVVAVIEAEQLSGVVLVGHSYGGMVITGVAEALPGRIRRLVYSDAYVPGDGDSCWDLTSVRFRELFADGAGGDGFSVRPPAGIDPRASAHPLASFMQKIRLTGRRMASSAATTSISAAGVAAPSARCTGGCAPTRPGTHTSCPSAITCSPTPRRSGWGSCWTVRSGSVRR